MIPSGRLPVPALLAAAGLLSIAAASCGGPGGRGAGADRAGADPEVPGALTLEVETREVLLLFASREDDTLRAERRQLPWNPSVEERARQAVLALIAGPEGDLLPVLPPGAILRELFVMKDGTAIVDFGASVTAGVTAGVAAGAPGSAAEFAAAYAVVDTLALNFPEIRRVGFLLEGEEPETLFGHLDARYPFAPSTAPLQAALAARLRAILAERGEAPVEGKSSVEGARPAPAPQPAPAQPAGAL